MNHEAMASMGQELPRPAQTNGDRALDVADHIRGTSITQVDNGYIVLVGCRTFVFDSVDDLLSKLTSYLKAPKATEESFFNKTLFP